MCGRCPLLGAKEIVLKVLTIKATTPITSSTLQDCAVVAVVVLLTAAVYVPWLGFYSDDWGFLRAFTFAGDQSLTGLVRSFFEADANTRARPVQALYLAALYRLFGLDPLGYHIVNTAVFAGGLCAFYLSLRTLCENRLLSLAVVLVYGTLPHYSTARFWYAVFQANLSMALYFAWLYCVLQLLTETRRRYAAWAVGAALCLLGSVLAYEVFIPLFLFSLLVVGVKHRQLVRVSQARSSKPVDIVSLYVIPTVLIALCVLFKGEMSERGGAPRWSALSDALPAAVELTVGVYVVNLPRILATIFRHHFDGAVLGISLISAVGIYLALKRAAQRDSTSYPTRLVLVLTLIGGFVVAGLSYAYFFSYFRVGTGINNRVTIAAAVCVAFFLVSGVSLVGSLLPLRLRKVSLCFGIAAVCFCGSLITSTVAAFWVDASRAQAEVLRGMKAAWPSPPTNSSILLMGFCSWIGPGIVVETNWDVRGAVGLLYGDRTLAGNVLRPWMTAEADGLRTPDTLFSYASLHVYDARTGLVHRIADQASASRILRALAEEDVSGCAGNYNAFGAGLPIW